MTDSGAKCVYNHPSRNTAEKPAELVVKSPVLQAVNEDKEKELSDQIYLCDILVSELSALPPSPQNHNFISMELLRCLAPLGLEPAQDIPALLKLIQQKKDYLIKSLEAIKEAAVLAASPLGEHLVRRLESEKGTHIELEEDLTQETKNIEASVMTPERRAKRWQSAQRIQTTYRSWTASGKRTPKYSLTQQNSNLFDAYPTNSLEVRLSCNFVDLSRMNRFPSTNGVELFTSISWRCVE